MTPEYITMYRERIDDVCRDYIQHAPDLVIISPRALARDGGPGVTGKITLTATNGSVTYDIVDVDTYGNLTCRKSEDLLAPYTPPVREKFDGQ